MRCAAAQKDGVTPISGEKPRRERQAVLVLILRMFSAFAAAKLVQRIGTSLKSILLDRAAAPVTYSTQAVGSETLEQIRSRIFGTHIGNGLRSGRKLLRKKLVGEKIVSYYPVPIAKSDPLFVNLDVER